MKMNRYTLAMALLLVAACRQEPLPDSSTGTVGFAVSETIPDLQTKSAGTADRLKAGESTLSVTETWFPVRTGGTKASAVYASTDTTPLKGDPIAVWAYNMASSDAAVSAWKLDGGSASGVVKASYSNGKWNTSVPYNSSKRAASWFTRWFAIAPYDAVSDGTLARADGTAPSFVYTVSQTDVADQHDLMVASTTPRAVDNKDDVPLSFTHVLTGIRLTADDGVNLSAATLSGVYDRATLDLTTRTWSSLDKSTATPTFTKTGGDFDKDAGIMMMIPQWLPAGAKLTLTVDGTTVEADLSGHEWKMGKMVTYRVVGAQKDYHIEFEVSGELDSSGTAAAVASINCYSTPTGGGDNTPESWTVKGVYSTLALANAGGTPDLAGWSASVSGGNLQVSAPAASGVSQTVNQLLQAAPEWGTADAPWNLANRLGGDDRIVESANTYIINAPGYYRIPLVIGNGVKNGSANTSAYPSPFVNYKGASITNPYLHSMDTPSTGAVVWTETSGMVENLSVVNDTENELYWLTFNIQASKIAQGCTVVSVKDGSGVVMWSWLLWVTDYEPGAGDVACTNATFMPRNLGWTVDGTLTGAKPAAIAYVRVAAENNPSVYAVVRVRRASGAPSAFPKAGHGPFFQWGRKDAMPPLTMSAATFNNSGTKTPADLIKNPSVHYGDTYYPYRGTSGYTQKNWWSAQATDVGQELRTVKTVYDPSPAGYTVPRRNAFNDLTGAWASDGWAFDGGLFLPVTGRRKPDNTVSDKGTGGYYWSAIPHGDGTSRRLSFTSSGINLPSGSSSQSKAGEESLRPAREE